LSAELENADVTFFFEENTFDVVVRAIIAGLTFDELDGAEDPRESGVNGDARNIGFRFEAFDESGVKQQPNRPIRALICPLDGTNVENLALFNFNEDTGEWEPSNSLCPDEEIEIEDGCASIPICHFSQFNVFELEEADDDDESSESRVVEEDDDDDDDTSSDDDDDDDDTSSDDDDDDDDTSSDDDDDDDDDNSPASSMTASLSFAVVAAFVALMF